MVPFYVTVFVDVIEWTELGASTVSRAPPVTLLILVSLADSGTLALPAVSTSLNAQPVVPLIDSTVVIPTT